MRERLEPKSTSKQISDRRPREINLRGKSAERVIEGTTTPFLAWSLNTPICIRVIYISSAKTLPNKSCWGKAFDTLFMKHWRRYSTQVPPYYSPLYSPVILPETKLKHDGNFVVAQSRQFNETYTFFCEKRDRGCLHIRVPRISPAYAYINPRQYWSCKRSPSVEFILGSLWNH